jgi:hypothetical protein
MGHTRNPDFRYEDLGDELLVCDPASGTVVRLLNGDADALRGVLTSPSVSLRHPGADPATLERLAAAGIVVAEDSGSNLTRRRVLQLSAAGAAAAGLAVVALPNAAAASSPEPPDPPPPPPPESGPAGSNTGVQVFGGSNAISITWGQDAWPEPFDYTYTITLDGDQVFSGTLTSSPSFSFTSIGNLGAGAGKTYVVTYTSLTTPSTTFQRSGTTA